MKTKLSLAILATLLLSAIYVTVSNPENHFDSFQKAGMNPIMCTVAKYMLSNVDTTQQIAPLFENLGNLHVSISTSHAQAQKFFDQGVRLSYAFNHAEAHRSFMEASRLDPNAAMTFWGAGLCPGAQHQRSVSRR